MAIRLVILFLFLPAKVFAASCCGGGVGASSLILGDLRARVQIQEASSAWYGRYKEGRYLELDKSPEIRRFTMEAIYQSDEYWQLGASVLLEKSVIETQKRLKSSVLNFFYEFLPEVSFSQWKPRGFFSVGIKNVKQANLGRKDIFSPILGLTFSKRFENFLVTSNFSYSDVEKEYLTSLGFSVISWEKLTLGAVVSAQLGVSDIFRLRSQLNMRINGKYVNPTISVYSDDLLGLGNNIVGERGLIIGLQYDYFM